MPDGIDLCVKSGKGGKFGDDEESDCAEDIEKWGFSNLDWEFSCSRSVYHLKIGY